MSRYPSDSSVSWAGPQHSYQANTGQFPWLTSSPPPPPPPPLWWLVMGVVRLAGFRALQAPPGPKHNAMKDSQHIQKCGYFTSRKLKKTQPNDLKTMQDQLLQGLQHSWGWRRRMGWLCCDPSLPTGERYSAQSYLASKLDSYCWRILNLLWCP